MDVDESSLPPVLRLSGVLDGREAAAVRRAIYDALTDLQPGDGCPLLIDLSEATLVDLTVLRAVAVASRRAEQQGTRLVLRGGSVAVRRCARLAGLGRWLRWERTDPGSRERGEVAEREVGFVSRSARAR